MLYLLHGLTDSATGWARLTNAEYLPAMVNNYILIMPEVQRSFMRIWSMAPNISPILRRNCPSW